MIHNCDENLKTLVKPSFQKQKRKGVNCNLALRSEEAEDLAINQSWKRVKVNSKLNIESEILKLFSTEAIFQTRFSEQEKAK